MVEYPEKTPSKSSDLFLQRVIDVLQPFLGAQTEVFIRRQCTHIRVYPENLSKEHLSVLGYWIHNSAKLTMPKGKADQLYQQLMLLEK
jgi:hypothetical protein